MRTVGIDIGSRTIAYVEWDGTRIDCAVVIDTGADPLTRSRQLLGAGDYDRIMATGYGRHLLAQHTVAHEVLTEIKAYAIGARFLYPDSQTVLDIGGQDSKIIRLKPTGGVATFEMNDRCAAGTGRFLESMARALGMEIGQFGSQALAATGDAIQLSSTCAVFAESEVVSLIGRGEDPRRIALGVHQAIVFRISGMIRRVGFAPRFVFGGGVAQNPCICALLAETLGCQVTVPEQPQLLGALGAALYAAHVLSTAN
jgi:predicted CoA-substrate-specific enzyme activase